MLALLHLAYLDPGAGSLILQALLGTIAAGWVFFRHLWWRISGRAVPRVEATAEAKPDGQPPAPTAEPTDRP